MSSCNVFNSALQSEPAEHVTLDMNNSFIPETKKAGTGTTLTSALSPSSLSLKKPEPGPARDQLELDDPSVVCAVRDVSGVSLRLC